LRRGHRGNRRNQTIVGFAQTIYSWLQKAGIDAAGQAGAQILGQGK